VEFRYLGESGRGHLHAALVRGVDLQVVAVGAVQAEEAAAWEPGVVAWGERTQGDIVVTSPE